MYDDYDDDDDDDDDDDEEKDSLVSKCKSSRRVEVLSSRFCIDV